MKDLLVGVIAHFSLSRAKKEGRARKIAELAVLVIVVLAIAIGLLLLLYYLQGALKHSLAQYALIAYLIVFVATFLSSATVLIPAPGLAIELAAAAQWNPLWVAIAAATGSTLGESTAYWVGYVGRAVISRDQSAVYKKVEGWAKRYGGVAISLVAFIPMFIFDLVGIAAGALRFPFHRFLFFVLLGRIPRALIEAYLGGRLLQQIFPGFFS